jgi:metalloprotease
MTLREKATRSLGRVIASVFQVVFSLLVVVFLLGSLVGQAKGCLSCVGFGKKDQAKLQARALDEKNEEEQRLRRALESICHAAGASTDKLRVVIVDTDEVNAASFGDSAYLLFGGIKRLPSSALDGVLAHEVAHDLHQHSRKAARVGAAVRILTSIFGFFVGSDSNGTEEVSDWATSLTLPKYNRDQELEADASAVKILASAGYGAGANDVMRYALEWLRRNLGDSGGRFLDSHPSTAERISRLEATHAGKAEAWEEFSGALETSHKRPAVVQYLEIHPSADFGELLLGGLARLDDREILERTALVGKILDLSPVAVCAGVVSRDYGAVAAALNLAGSAPAKRLAKLNEVAIDAQLDDKPEIVANKDDLIAAFDDIAGQLPPDESTRLNAALKHSAQISRDDLCWSSRALFAGIGRMRDTRAAAKFARQIARYP